jgi:hypothetical protein
MEKLNLEILLLEGLNDLKFGDTPAVVEKTLGNHRNKKLSEEGDEVDEELDTILWEYDNEGMTVFFEGKNNHVLSCFETDNAEATLVRQRRYLV